MTLTGSTGRPEYVGTYERSEKTAHGAPVFVKEAGDKTHYLFRYSDRIWKATDNEKYFATGQGFIQSSKPSDLPSDTGLSWTYWDGKAMVDDPIMNCTTVRDTQYEPLCTLLNSDHLPNPSPIHSLAYS